MHLKSFNTSFHQNYTNLHKLASKHNSETSYVPVIPGIPCFVGISQEGN